MVVVAGQQIFIQVSSFAFNFTGPLTVSINEQFDLSLTQPGGAGSLEVRNSCGPPGAIYITAVTFQPGNFPNGWWFGIDIPLLSLVTEINSGVPFFGTLDGMGSSLFSVPAPLTPPGVDIYAVSITLDAGGIPTFFSAPVNLLTL